jgi:hypothetical protein
VTGSRGLLLLALLCGVVGLAANLRWDASADLRPVMPEVDGVHPVRALEALSSAYAPGLGFEDKYPPLASALMGLVSTTIDSGFRDDVGDVVAMSEVERQDTLWKARDRLAAMLNVQRWVSRLAMSAALGLLALLAFAAARAVGAGPISATLGALMAGIGFGLSYPALYYGATTNVDALCLAGCLAALWLAASGRWDAAAAAAAAAAAVKDPAFVLAPVLLLGVLLDDRPRRAARTFSMVAVGLIAYGLLSGAVTGPQTWWRHLGYLLEGGVEGVDRIDPADPAQWGQLFAHAGGLAVGALGWGASTAGLLGWVLVARRDGRLAWLLPGTALVVVLLFVLPVGFVYVRFLLLPMALLAAGAGVALAWLLSLTFEALAQRGGAAGFATLLAFVWLGFSALVLDRHVDDYHGTTAPSPDARVEAALAVAELVPAGSRIVVFADERRHAVPLDPTRWSVDVRGLDGAEAALAEWAVAPPELRPEFLLWMSFPTVLPSGREQDEPQPPRPGERLAGTYEVLATFGAPPGDVPRRTLAVRPMVSLLTRVGG